MDGNKNSNNKNSNETDNNTAIKGPHIELNVFIKKLGLASSGGQAKNIIRSGSVLVNGTVETRNKKKLHDKDIVEIEGKKYTVDI